MDWLLYVPTFCLFYIHLEHSHYHSFLSREIHSECGESAGDAQHQHGGFDGKRPGPAGWGLQRISAGGG